MIVVRKTFSLAAIFVILYLFPNKVFGAVLFSEDFELGSLSSWSSSGGSATATISAETAHGGVNSIKVQHGKTSSYGFQTVIPNIEGGMFYDTIGYGNSTDSATASFFIRLAWYSSFDGGGSQLSQSYDSNTGNSSTSDWQLLSQTIQAPTGANSAKLRLVLNSKSQNLLASAYFDDIVFQESTHTPTPTPSPTPTSTTTSSPMPTWAPTPTPTPVKTPSPTPTETAESPPYLEDISTDSGVLGLASESGTHRPLQTTAPEKQKNNFPFIAAGFMIVGIGLIGFSVFSIIKGLKKSYTNDSEKSDLEIS